jgi:hypothetical protein
MSQREVWEDQTRKSDRVSEGIQGGQGRVSPLKRLVTYAHTRSRTQGKRRSVKRRDATCSSPLGRGGGLDRDVEKIYRNESTRKCQIERKMIKRDNDGQVNQLTNPETPSFRKKGRGTVRRLFLDDGYPRVKR